MLLRLRQRRAPRVYINSNSSNDLEEYYLTSIDSHWAAHDLTKIGGAATLAPLATPSALYHSGYTSVYYADANADLWETYLTAIGDSWASQDLTTKYKTEGVTIVFDNKSTGEAEPLPGHVSAVYHSGYVDIFSTDLTGQVHDAFLPAISDGWQNQNLTTNATPNIGTTNAVFPLTSLVHYDAKGGLTWTSLYSINVPSGTLQETYLQKIGDDWVSQAIPS